MATTDLPPLAALAAEPVRCAHCALPVPAGRIEPGAARSFCCAGCDAAWALVHELGLEGYYALGTRRNARVESSGRSFEEFDHAAFRDLYVTRDAAGRECAELYLEGVVCASCVWLVERVPLGLPGLARAELDVPRSRVRVAWDPGEIALSAIARELDGLGYRPHPYRGGRADARRRAEDRRRLEELGIAGALSISVMMVAMFLYSGWLSGIEREYDRYFRWLSLLLTTPALLGPGRTFFRGAWAGLRTRTLHMDLPIAIALAAGWARGAVNTITDRGPIYLDGVAMLVFLLLAGRYLQLRAQRSAADSGELLHALAPSIARLVDGGRVTEVPVEALLPGMIVEVRPGDTLPTDGVVESGRSELDVSLLTGESRARLVSAGDEVFAGTINRESPLRIRVERVGESTRLAHLARQVEEGTRRRAPVVRLADRMSGAFVAAVLALAAITALIWLARDPSLALDHAIALLVVTCPCALALATPLAVTVAIGRAARAGILVKGGDALEALARPSRLVLDKTGTLTTGRLALARWEGPAWAQPLVASLERESPHPIARAFLDAWPGAATLETRDGVHVAGGGIEGVVDGRRVVVGSPSFVSSRISRGPEPSATPEVTSAFTPVWIAVDGALVARAGFADAVRADAAGTLAWLRERGWSLGLLSGDDPAVVAEVGGRLGFAGPDLVGGASPERKRDAIEAAGRDGPVVMVGDGVNDAVALACATVGVGVRGGAEAALAAADVYLGREGLAPLADLVRGAAATMRVIRFNIALSLAYNVAGVALAMAGVLNPLIAAVLMPASSLTVVMISWRARTFERRDG